MIGTDVATAMQAPKRPDNDMEDFFLNGIMKATIVQVPGMLPQTTKSSDVKPIDTKRF